MRVLYRLSGLSPRNICNVRSGNARPQCSDHKTLFCLYRYVQLDCMQISDATVPICPQTGTETTWTRGPTAMSNNNRRVEETGRRTKGEELKPGRIFNWRRESVSKRYKIDKKGCDTVLFVFRKVKTKYQRSLLNLR